MYVALQRRTWPRRCEGWPLAEDGAEDGALATVMDEEEAEATMTEERRRMEFIIVLLIVSF